MTERAKRILMERHGIDERAAFELLRGHARRTNQKIVEVAERVIDTHHLLLPAVPPDAAAERLTDGPEPDPAD